MAMSDDGTDLGLESAQQALREALARLSVLRRAALSGTYDSDEFAKAVAAYRAAEATIAAARRARMERLCNANENASAKAEASSGLTPAPEDSGSLGATPRLLFARWLVQTGRISG
jgi:hypothetical protein